jgi:hypothetical protein
LPLLIIPCDKIWSAFGASFVATFSFTPFPFQ